MCNHWFGVLGCLIESDLDGGVGATGAASASCGFFCAVVRRSRLNQQSMLWTPSSALLVLLTALTPECLLKSWESIQQSRPLTWIINILAIQTEWKAEKGRRLDPSTSSSIKRTRGQARRQSIYKKCPRSRSAFRMSLRTRQMIYQPSGQVKWVAFGEKSGTTPVGTAARHVLG